MMDNKQLALKVMLDVLGEDSDISTVNDRLRVQKAVYLAQVLGINLGYHYSWYVKGPYSPGLTQDYYRVSEAVAGGDDSYENRTLNAGLAALIPRIKKVLAKPGDVNIQRERWLEALASLHFLIETSSYTVDQARDYLAKVKPHLNGVFDRALRHLREHGLVA
jgi:hypothetical protein